MCCHVNSCLLTHFYLLAVVQFDQVFLVNIFFEIHSIINILFSRKEFRADGDLVQLLSINSENGVIKFSADAYESFGGTDDPVQLLGNNISGPVIGIFFSSTTEDLQF